MRRSGGREKPTGTESARQAAEASRLGFSANAAPDVQKHDKNKVDNRHCDDKVGADLEARRSVVVETDGEAPALGALGTCGSAAAAAPAAAARRRAAARRALAQAVCVRVWVGHFGWGRTVMERDSRGRLGFRHDRAGREAQYRLSVATR